MQRCAQRLGLLLALALVGVLQAGAQVALDWNAVDWPTGQLTHSFDIDTNNPGPDLTIAFSGATSRFNPPVDDNSAMTGGYGPTEESLELHVDYANTNEAVITTITFHYPLGVESAWVRLFDIDFSDPKIDFVSEISASWGTNRFPATVTPAATPSFLVTSNGTLDLSLRAHTNVPNNQGAGNATIGFGGQILTSLAFKHQVLASTIDPPRHGIALHDIGFTPVRPPAIKITRQSAQVVLSWPSRTNCVYQVQWTPDLPADSWTNLGAAFLGDGATKHFTNALPHAGRYYRLSVSRDWLHP